MLNSAVVRIALGGAALALVLTLVRYIVGGWQDDLPNTIAGFVSAGAVGGALGTYAAFMTRKFGQLRAVIRAD